MDPLPSGRGSGDSHRGGGLADELGSQYGDVRSPRPPCPRKAHTAMASSAWMPSGKCLCTRHSILAKMVMVNDHRRQARAMLERQRSKEHPICVALE